MIWQPLERDVDPRDMIVSRAVRTGIARYPDGHRETIWQEGTYGGRMLRLRLHHAPRQTLAYQGRAALLYAVSGEVLEGLEGYRCEASAILDLKTRAFLNVACRLIPLGPVEPGN
ncbi:hypothetical protein [Xanthobacter agilis]|jgi:hypothetical protein|uniref:hypothetical protein n=1 Tax=Xanthobacter agilis TaxID=47492 RepID=UPI003729C96B